ncbi:acyltransferase [Sedimentibacter hydroxybenzoicus DSM 7310]|uniref:Acyltransferase n=1 Tax=Sedimentibacter hydroxybenzoicus DSM 7310 TaxID=1123245 RepID=A0A974GXE9_SEDHY|nr:acyltransferase [Sedimentibacter hydroxybenzoicus]NYB75141.1 acyltransferase [Sedimentibacter hydroxybenzoicus DSM 7310]
MNTKEKLYELDYMRFIACFAVMIVHITATGVEGYIHGSFPHIVTLIVNRSFKFTTPIFIFLSGVTSFYSYRNRDFKYFEFIKKRLLNVLVAYIVWCVIYYAAYIKLGYYGFNINEFIKSVLLGKMSYHLYFVIIITQMYIFGPIFYKLLKNSDKKVAILIIAAIFTALCAEYIRFKDSDRLFLKYIFFYMLGIYLTLEYDKFTSFLMKNKWLFIIGYAVIGLTYTVVSYLNMAIYIYVWFIFSLTSIFFVYIAGLIMKDAFKKYYSFIKLFGQSSYYIYLMHPLVLTLAIRYTDMNGILSITKRLIIYSVAVIPTTVICCLGFTAAKNYLKKKRKATAAVASEN